MSKAARNPGYSRRRSVCPVGAVSITTRSKLIVSPIVSERDRMRERQNEREREKMRESVCVCVHARLT